MTAGKRWARRRTWEIDSEPERDQTAEERLDRVISGVVIAARVLAIAQTTFATGAVRRTVKHRLPLYGSVAVVTAESAWAVARSVRRGTVRDPVVAWWDVLVADLVLAGEAASWGSRRLPPDPRWSQVYGLLTAAWTSFGNGDPAQSTLAAASWVATFAASTTNRALDRGGVTVSGQRFSEMAGGAVFYGVGVNLGQGLRAQARELDAARTDAVHEAERNATEIERINQHRLLHDSVLHVLEAVAGSWNVDSDLLVRRTDFEVERLRRVLSGGGLAPVGGLIEAVEALRSEFALLGFEVVIHASAGPFRCSRATIEILNDAAHESLMNAHKHAGTANAAIALRSNGDFVILTISDHGRGFDLTQPRTGFGVTESIQRRLRDAGGSAELASSPDVGTTVTLRMPR